MRSTTTLALTLCLLAGCSLLNSPDRDLIRDDGGVDMEVADAGLDGDVPTDVFDGGPLVEDCDEPGDEDGNGLSDCSDFACVGDADCCVNGTRVAINLLQGSPGWVSSGNVEVRREVFEDVVFPGDDPGTYVNNSCFPLAQGAMFEVDIGQDNGIETDCMMDGADRCQDFAAFFLSSVTVAAPGASIVAELGVRVYASGRAELYRERGEEDDVIETIDAVIAAGANIRIVFRIAPDVVDGVGVLRADVSVNMVPFPTLMGTIPQSNLLAECADGISGLHYGFEGQGRRLSIEKNEAVESTLACTNPTQFRDTLRRPLVASDPDATRTNLDWRQEGWTVADVTHPELVRVVTAGNPEPIWHVFGSTAPRQLEFSTLRDFPWTTDHSVTATWNNDPWLTPDAHFQLEGGVQPTVASDGTGLVFLAIENGVLNYCSSPEVACVRIDTGECEGLANPSVVATPGGNYLLFYQCTVNTNQTEVRGLALNNRVIVQADSEPFIALSAGAFGDLARNAIVDFDVLLDARPAGDEYVVRAWFVGEALGNVRTLLLATGGIKLSADNAVSELDDLQGGVTLMPYGANPIATENVLFRDPSQTLQGVSVERDGSPQALLFLFGRRTERAEGRLYDFVPIEQTWGEL